MHEQCKSRGGEGGLCGEKNGLNCGLENEIINETRDLHA